jgi:hypothetical protein
MTRPIVTLADLADELEAHGRTSSRGYQELDVFADDVEEVRALRDGKQPDSLRPLASDGHRFTFEHLGRRYEVELSERGVVRLSKEGRDLQRSGSVPKEMLQERVRAAIAAAETKKGKGWAVGLVLGLLVGAMMGTAVRRRRVLTVRFDPGSRRWSAYDGGLVSWVKEELQPTG